jgi:hypothetical protein
VDIQEIAACSIQNVFRGWKARKLLREMKSKDIADKAVSWVMW